MKRHFRLRGQLGEITKSFPLREGETRIGSARDNELCVSIRGVSRHHARIDWRDGALVLEDLQSKNGVKVNTTRIQRTLLQPGDEIRLGPVLLVLEEIDPADASLGIVTDGFVSKSDVEEVLSGATAALLPETRWMGLLDAFLGALGRGTNADLPGACGVLVRELPARGVCIVESNGEREPVLVASAGTLQALPSRLPGPPEGPPSIVFSSEDSVPPLTYAASSGESSRLGIVIWGEFQGRAESELLVRTLLRIVERSRPSAQSPGREGRPTARLSFPETYIAGVSPAIKALYEQMAHLLQGDLPVLLLGETGAGKEHLARILHISSTRGKGPIVAINCAAIPADLLEAEMFGIGKGIATGVSQRKGKFQQAEGGTLFLDEIGDMSPELQAKLLRALQEKEVQPIGGSPVPLNVRIIAATNTDLFSRVSEGRFRRDVYYRIAGYTLRVPPLRERREDIPLLVAGFVARAAAEAGKGIRGVSVKALEVLATYDWPGNIRELEHEIRRLVYVCPAGQAIDSLMLPAYLSAPAAPLPLEEQAGSLDLQKQVNALESRLIREALARAKGNHSKAAKLLGISRNGLALKFERLGLKDVTSS